MSCQHCARRSLLWTHASLFAAPAAHAMYTARRNQAVLASTAPIAADLGAADEAHRRQPKAVRLDGLDGRRCHVWVVRQPHVVVGAGHGGGRRSGGGIEGEFAGLQRCRAGRTSGAGARRWHLLARTNQDQSGQSRSPEVEHRLGCRLHTCSRVSSQPKRAAWSPGRSSEPSTATRATTPTAPGEDVRGRSLGPPHLLTAPARS